MTEVLLGVGSNIEREHHIGVGLDALAELLGEIELSPVYDSAAIGFDGDAFLNLVVRANTDMTLAVLAAQLRNIEFQHGRPPNASRCSPRRLDIDILTFGDLTGEHAGIVLPRPEILVNSFVLRPLADLMPHALHPGVGRSYAELWEEYDAASQALQRTTLEWRVSMAS